MRASEVGRPQRKRESRTAHSIRESAKRKKKKEKRKISEAPDVTNQKYSTYIDNTI